GLRDGHLRRTDGGARGRRAGDGASAHRARADTGGDDLAATGALSRADRAGDLPAMSDAVRRIAMWSGPRNLSTAMMRSFGSRADCAVSDEPFYAAYLKATGLDHPMRDAVLASQNEDAGAVAAAMLGPVPGGKPV